MKWVLLDIEGTTSDKRFVTKTLFPFSRERMKAYLAAQPRTPEVEAALGDLARVLGRPLSPSEAAEELVRWIDADLKKEPLKTLQGHIWREGYRSGALTSHVYGDVPAALEGWRRAGARLAVFSSGSIEAQKLLFAHTVAGDLLRHLERHFDLTTGPKTEAASYRHIAAALGVPPADIRFYSDAPAEVSAALAAGLEAVLVERDGPIAAEVAARRISSFEGEHG